MMKVASPPRHLILLVGSNPIPNAVSGQLLTGSSDEISLIYTDETVAIANNLKKYFTNHHYQIVRSRKVPEAEPASIFSALTICLDAAKAREVILNYTGGTKVMAVHAYRAVEQWAAQKVSTGEIDSVAFSYLEAKTLMMEIEPLFPENSEAIPSQPVGTSVILKLEEMMKLHGWSLSTQPREKPLLPQTAACLADLYSSGRGNAWIDWKQTEFKPLKTPFLGERVRWKSENELRAANLQLSGKAALQPVFHTFLNEISLPDEQQVIKLQDVFRLAGFSSVEDMCSWLDGKWLEHHVLDQLNKLTGDTALHSCAQNIEPREVKFDLDVVAIRGYQLFALSCSTDTDRGGGRVRLKKRLFEAFIRAAQIGGDEARVALVCCATDPLGLKNEIRRDFDYGNRIQVFGQSALNDLKTHFRNWIREQSREE